MLVIGNNKYRNLQEQVGSNTEQIEKILEQIDGMTLEDKLITISSSGGTLSAEELQIASGEIAFIYNTSSKKFYVKSAVDSSYHFVSCQITITSIAGGGYKIAQETVAVNATTGVYNTITSASQNVYSKSEMDTALALKADLSYVDAQLALKANLSGADFTGAVTAPTFNQTSANYTFPLTANVPTGCVLDPNSFTAIKVINGVFYFVYEARITNPTESDVTGNIGFTAVGINTAVSSKVYRKDGTTCNNAPSTSNAVCNYAGVTQLEGSGTRNIVGGILTSYSANVLTGYVPNITINAGKYIDVSFRFELTLL